MCGGNGEGCGRSSRTKRGSLWPLGPAIAVAEALGLEVRQPKVNASPPEGMGTAFHYTACPVDAGSSFSTSPHNNETWFNEPIQIHCDAESREDVF